jgi:hypothetical protein
MRFRASGVYLLSGKRWLSVLEGLEGFAGGLRVALGEILVGQRAEEAQVFVEVGQALQVIGVIDVRVVRVQLDEALAGRHRRRLLVRLVVGVGHLELRLLGVAAVGVARLELLEHLDGAVPGAVAHGLLGFGVELLGAPADGFVRHVGEAAASGEQQEAGKR